MEVKALLEVLDETPNARQVSDCLLYGRARAMRRLLLDRLASNKRSPLLNSVLITFNELPETFRLRILVSAEFGQWNSDQESNQSAMGEKTPSHLTEKGLKGLLELLKRERFISMLLEKKSIPRDDSVGNQVWSPMGDWFAVRKNGNYHLEKAPTVGEVVAVDFDSPLAIAHEPKSGVLSQPRLNISLNERESIIVKLERALNLIDRFTPEYGLMIRNFVRRIIIRKTATRSNGSEHVPRQPGSIRILNPNYDGYSVCACSETLIHESVHNLLAAWEVMHSPFTPSAILDYRPISPWSGNPIPNPSLFHAIFVYYAIHRFFRQLRNMSTCFGQLIFE